MNARLSSNLDFRPTSNRRQSSFILDKFNRRTIMKIRNIFIKPVSALAITMLMFFAQQASASDAVTVVKSNNSFEQTIAKLKKAVGANKLAVLKAFDHQKMVKMVGANADKSMSFEIFHPRFGKKINAKDRSAFMIAPLRVMVQMDGKDVVVRFQKASVLLKPYSGLDELGAELDTLMGQVVNTATH